MNPPIQSIPEPTRRLFLAAMEAEAHGFTGLAASIRQLLRPVKTLGASWTLVEPQKARKGAL